MEELTEKEAAEERLEGGVRMSHMDIWYLRKSIWVEAVFLPEKFHGQRSLVGYSPWGNKRLKRN